MTRLPPETLPPLHRDRAFAGIATTQFLGALNDNLFKQMLLLLALAVLKKRGEGSIDPQWLGMLVFSLPFLLFSGYAGYLSDRFSKRTIIVLAKVGEIVVMSAGLIAFATYGMTYGQFGLAGVFVVLWFMGTQSALFGPSKYGILPEMLRRRDLSRANGFILMTTFLAIIIGVALAGMFCKSLIDEERPIEQLGSQLWMASIVCIGIAVVGTLTATLIRRLKPANPSLQFNAGSLTIPADTRAMLRRDRPLMTALLVSSVFWMVAGVAQPSVNSLGMIQLRLDEMQTSFMAGGVGIGIALGCVLAGWLSGDRVDFRIVRVGAWGIVGCLLVMSLPGANNGHWLGYPGSLPVLILLGVSTGMFAVPLQVFLQARPPDGQKGRIIAVMNQANFTGIIASSFVYLAFDRLVTAIDWPRCAIFAFTAALMLPVAVFYHPKSERLDGNGAA